MRHFIRWERLAANELVPVTWLASSNANAVEKAKLNDIAQLLWLPEGIGVTDRDALIVKVIDLLESIKPDDGIEAMLATQMVGTHAAVMKCVRRAMLANQTRASPFGSVITRCLSSIELSDFAEILQHARSYNYDSIFLEIAKIVMALALTRQCSVCQF